MKKKGAKKKQKGTSQLGVFLILGIIGVFLLCVVYAFYIQQENVVKVHLPYVPQRPLPIASSSASLTPTEIPLSGFCLYAPVLMYHHVQPQAQAEEKKQTSVSIDNGMFEQHMAYLANNGYTTITAKQLVDALRSHSQLPAKSILVTLDDGYKDVYDYAYPIFQKYHITANLMIPTGLLGGSDYLQWPQLEEMSRSGLIYITDHTWSHYSLPQGSLGKKKYEIETARAQLEQHTGQIVNIFTYPYGSFDNASIAVLQEDGFIGAFSTLPGMYQCDSFIMTLHRNRIGNSSLSYYGL